MDLLFLNRCYWPDVEATGQLLMELCSDLARTHRVAVIAGQPNFRINGTCRLPRRQEHEGVQIIRVGNRRFTKKSFLGRILGLLSYLLLAAWAAFRHRRPDVIVVETDPPVLGALGAILKAWHGSPMVLYLQDLYPEVGLVIGRLRRGPLSTLLYAATQVGLLRADYVIVLGEDMRQRVLKRGIDPNKVVVVPNWVDVNLIRPRHGANPFRQELGVGDRFIIMYSGNLGLSQNLEQVLEAARELRDEPVLFLLVGEGAAKAALTKKAADWGLVNVRFLAYQPKEKLGQSLTAADLHLIPLRRGLAGCLVPSKLYGILASGVPYLALVDRDSDVARIAEASHSGLWIEPDCRSQLIDAIRWCLAHPEELRQMGRSGRELAERAFHRSLSVAKIEDVLRRAAIPKINHELHG